MKTLNAIILIIFLYPLPQRASAQERAPENESIRQQDLRADLFFLSSDALQGRLTATRDNRIAAEFIKSRFERMGLTPAGPENSYYQIFNLSTATLGSGNSLVITFPGQNRDIQLKAGQDYYPLNFSASGRSGGTLVYAGFGITSPIQSHDDYRRGESVAGKVVLVLNHEPGERDPDSPFDGLVTSEASRTLRKALYAQEQGAVAILFVSDIHNHPEPVNFEASAKNYWPDETRRVPRYGLADWVERVRIPAAIISPALARTLISGTNRTLEELSSLAEKTGGITPISISGVEINLHVSVNRHIVQERNVVARMEGVDPAVADELIILCAHYDHNGVSSAGIYNGADDDGSGTVALIEIAEAYALAASKGHRPRRSVLFAAWNAEERGLLGAWAYTERPLYPLERTVAVINMDMIGRNEEVQEGGGRRFRGLEIQTAESNSNAVNILGYTYSPDLRAEIEQANVHYGLDLKMRYDNNASNLLRRSDQWPFLQNGVPAVFVHTGLHPDYHTVYDQPEKINYVKMEKIARLVHQTSWNLAQGKGRPRFAQ